MADRVRKFFRSIMDSVKHVGQHIQHGGGGFLWGGVKIHPASSPLLRLGLGPLLGAD